MEQKVLNGRHRKEHGKAFAANLRRNGRVPGVMYDRHGKALSIDADYNEFERLFKSVTESTIVQVKLDNNDEYQVFIKDYQYDMVRNRINHFDLYEVEAGKLLRTLVGIKLEGAPSGVRDGGVLETGVVEIEIECLPRDLPPRIIVDVSNLGVNESIHVRDLKLPDAVKVLSEEDQVVATVKYISGDKEAPKAAAEGAEPGVADAPAEAAKAE
jgi:ribosomal protein L25, ctc-form